MPPRTATEEGVIDFDDFYRQEFGRMVTLACAVSGSRIAGEDIAQDALLQARQNWDTVGRYEKPGAWLRRVTIQLASKRLRRARAEAAAWLRIGNPPPPMPPGPDEVETVLAYLEDRSVKEVAEIMGCAEGTAKAHLHRARVTLARLLGDEGGAA